MRPWSGGNPDTHQVSAYELHAADFGSSPDRVWAADDQHPYVAGEFVWTGFDYLGEPTPYYTSRSSYSGIIDLAGFPKDRYWLYQSRWRPDLKFAHILPHWTWPGREGQVTPVHVFSSADEAELFVNGKFQGRIKKRDYEYRFRWDYVTYAPGESEGNSGLKGQIYCQGNFRCRPDEAVIFEAVPPPARHWNVSLANFYWEAVDFMTRQGSLNGAQAELDEDGVFRAVIAHHDPGVPNWLDPCGQEAGTLALRFILAEQELQPPVSRVVPFDSLRSELPAGTRRVSLAEREQRLRDRREALWLRYRR